MRDVVARVCVSMFLSSETAETARRTIFCKNLPYDATEEEIAERFDGVKEVRLAKKRENEESRGLVRLLIHIDVA